MKVPVSTKGFFGSAFSLCLSLAAIYGANSNRALANSIVSQQEAAIKIAPFDVDVTLTEKARQRLAQSAESIIVSASVFGMPKQGATVSLNEVGFVDLAQAQIELPKAGQARFNNLSVPASTRGQLASQDYSVNVNVFSGRKSSQDNLLSCDFFDGKLSQIQPGITLKCGLIGEYDGQYIRSSNNSETDRPSRPSNAIPALW